MSEKKSDIVVSVDADVEEVEVDDEVVEDDVEEKQEKKSVQAEPKSCFTKTLDVFFGKRPSNINSEIVGPQVIALLAILASNLQQLSLLIFEDLNFGLWGDIFGNINIFSLNIGNPFANQIGEILYLMGVFSFPIFLIVWYTNIALSDPKNKERFPKAKFFSWIVILASIGSSFALLFLVDFEAGLVAAFPGFFLIMLKLFLMLRTFIVRDLFEDNDEGEMKRIDFYASETSFVNFFISFQLPVLFSVWITVGILNEDEIIAAISGVVGGLIIIFLILRLYYSVLYLWEASFDNGRILSSAQDYKVHKLLQKLTYQLIIVKTRVPDNSDVDFKYFFIPLLLIGEKLAIASVPVLVADLGNGEDIEISEYCIAGLIFVTLGMFALVKPIDNHAIKEIGNKAEATTRLSNFMIFSLGIANTRLEVFEENEDDKTFSENFELYSSIVMIVISSYMLIYWVRLLDLKGLLKGIFFGALNTYRRIVANYRWRNCDSVKAARKIILKRKMQEVSEQEWKSLGHLKRMFTAGVVRTRQLTTDEETSLKVTNSLGVVSLQYESALYSGVSEDIVRKHGLSRLVGAKCLMFADYANNLVDFEALYDAGVLRSMNKKGLTGFGTEGRALSPEDMKYFLECLQTLERVEMVDFFSFGLDQKTFTQEHVDVLKTQLPRLEVLTTVCLRTVMLTDELATDLVETLIPSLDHLEHLSFYESGSLHDPFLERVLELVLEKEGSKNGSKLHTLNLGGQEFTMKKGYINARVFMRKKKVLNVLIMNQDNFDYLKNRNWKLTVQNPERQIVLETFWLEKDEDRDICNVFFKDVYDENPREEDNAFVTDEEFHYNVIYAITDDGNCSLLLLGLAMLNEKWTDIAKDVLKNSKVDFTVAGTEEDIEISLPEAIIRTAKKAKGQAVWALHELRTKYSWDINALSSDGKTSFLDMCIASKHKPLSDYSKKYAGVTNVTPEETIKIVAEFRKAFGMGTDNKMTNPMKIDPVTGKVDADQAAALKAMEPFMSKAQAALFKTTEKRLLEKHKMMAKFAAMEETNKQFIEEETRKKKEEYEKRTPEEQQKKIDTFKRAFGYEKDEETGEWYKKDEREGNAKKQEAGETEESAEE